MFDFLDINRDATISEAEAGRFWGMLGGVDKDGDRKVTQEEAEGLMKGILGGRRQRPNP